METLMALLQAHRPVELALLLAIMCMVGLTIGTLASGGSVDPGGRTPARVRIKRQGGRPERRHAALPDLALAAARLARSRNRLRTPDRRSGQGPRITTS